MKPYLRVLFNTLKLTGIRMLNCPSFTMEGIQLLGWNTRINVQRTSKVHFGNKVNSDGRLTIIVGDKAELNLGKYVYFNEHTMLSCHEKITIGDHCLIGNNVTIIDNDHVYGKEGIKTDITSSPVIIGNNCWIGANTVILKGTEIGDNCVIGAGCVVKGKIPSSSKVTQDRHLIIKEID